MGLKGTVRLNRELGFLHWRRNLLKPFEVQFSLGLAMIRRPAALNLYFSLVTGALRW